MVWVSSSTLLLPACGEVVASIALGRADLPETLMQRLLDIPGTGLRVCRAHSFRSIPETSQPTLLCQLVLSKVENLLGHRGALGSNSTAITYLRGRE
eukprot:2072793-Amphidinium_carterae.3